MMQKPLLFIIPQLLFLSSICCAGLPVKQVTEPSITCGMASKYKNRLIITNQTDQIPFITKQKNPNFYFGCKILYPDIIFKLHAEITTPQAGDIISNIEDSKNRTSTIVTEPVIFKGNGYVALSLNEGDLPGKYEIKLFIDNENVGDVFFDVNHSPE